MTEIRFHAGLSALAIVLASQPAVAQQADGNGVNAGEIVVTAQRRSELARDVPISLTALDGASLAAAGVKDTQSLTMVTPGLKMDRVGNFTLPAIRGVTTTITGPGADTNVALYLDGIYQPASTVNTFDLPDVQRVEVLKGPQGTLFGRNATGGAIQVFTKSPGNNAEGNFTASYGSYNDITTKGFVSVPLVEGKLAMSIAGFYEHSDSYYRNVLNGGAHPTGIDSTLIRGKLRWTPTDTISVLLTVLHADRSDPANILGNALNGNSVSRALVQPISTTAPVGSFAVIPTNPYEYASNSEPTQRSKTTAFSGKIDIDLAGGTLTSLTGYSRFENTSILDADYGYTSTGQSIDYHADSTDRAFSQELNFASKSHGPLNYSLGAFYYSGWGGWTPLGLRTPTLVANIRSRQDVESLAAFGELYYDINDKFTVIAGGRYSTEKRSFSSVFDFTLAPNPPMTYFATPKRWNSFTPRLSLRYKVTPTANIYFTYSKGFKSGLFDPSSFSKRADGTDPSVDPEKLTSYELGFKGRINNVLSLNAAVYHYDYKDIQVTFYKEISPTVNLSTIGNASAARINGAEFDATAKFSSIFDMRVGISILDAKYQNFKTASVQVPTSVNGVPLLLGNTNVSVDVSGKQMVKAPKFTSYLTGTFHLPVAGGTLDLNGTLYHSSSVPYTFDGRIRQKGYENVDARMAWTPDNGHYTVSAFGRNLTNAAVLSGSFVTSVADGLSWLPPRTFGVQIDTRF